MRGRCTLLAAAGLILAVAACQRQAPQGAEAAAHAADRPKPTLAAIVPQAAPAPSAQDFVNQAAASDAFEVAAGQIAQQRAQNAAVKALAAMMVHDHLESSVELKAALGESGQGLQANAGPDRDQQQALDELRRADAKAFDKIYLDGQVRAHQTALARLQAYAQNGQVTALQIFAGKAASLVQHHLQAAQDLDARMA